MAPPPTIRKGQVKLDFEGAGKEADAEHGQSEVDDHRCHKSKEEEHFIDLVHHVHGGVNQASIRLNEMLQKVRTHFLEDPKWLDTKSNYDQLTEICFELQAATYFLAKWHHQLEPRKVGAPTRPSKIEDMSADDILAQALYSISKMEVLAGKLGPVLEKICHDAAHLRRGPNGEPLTPTSKNALTLAKKRGFQDIDDFNHFMGHLEHILSVTLHLATPPRSGLPELHKIGTVLNAASKFKRGLKSKAAGETSPVKAAGMQSLIGGAFKDLSAATVENAAAQEEAAAGD